MSISKGMLAVLGEIASLLRGGVASGLKLVNNLLTLGFKSAFQFNEAAMAFSRQAGLSAKQAQAYTEVLATRAKTLGEKYGIAAEEVAKLEQNLAKATGRVIMLSNAQSDMQIALNRTVGEQTANEFAQTMIRTMGASVNSVQGAVSKAYATAAKRGFDAAGMSAKVAQNLGMVNRLNFRNGVDGLTRMVALSEKLGFNMSSMESAANKFIDLQDAIENSASLTMLGGAAGALGGNPLDMAYEANYDMEAFTERVTKMAAGFARFNPKTGMAESNGIDKDYVRQIAQRLGYSMDEFMAMANKQAEYTYKNNMFGADINRLTHGNNEQKEFILNKARYSREANNGRGGLVMTDRAGQERDISYFTSSKGAGELEEMMRFSKMSDEEIVREQAEAVISIKDQLMGYLTTAQGILAEKIVPHMNEIKQFVGDIWGIIKPHIKDIAENVKNLLAKLFQKETIDKIKSGIETIVDATMSIAKWITSSWSKLLIAAAVTPILASLGWIANLISTYRTANARGGMPGGGPGGGPGTGGGSGPTSVWGKFKGGLVRNSGKAWPAYKEAVRHGWRNMLGFRNAVRGTGAVTALMAGIEGYSAYSDYQDKKKAIQNDATLTAEERKKAMEKASNEAKNDTTKIVGSVIGSVLGGAVGALGGPAGIMIGASIGNMVGRGIGSWAGNAMYGNSEEESKVVVEGAHSGGINTPASGAKSVTNDKLKDVANGVRNLSITEKNETFITPSQRKNINEYIKAVPVGNKPDLRFNPSVTHQNINVDFNRIDVRVTIDPVRIEGGNKSREVNVEELVDSREFSNAILKNTKLVAAIREALNTNANVKINNDTQYLGGYTNSRYVFGG